MRSIVGMAVALLAAMVAGPAAVTADVCPLTASLTTTPKSTAAKARVMAGAKVTLNAKISKVNTKGALGQGVVTVNVPAEMCVLATRPRGAQIDAATGDVVWFNVNFNKAGPRKFQLRTRIQSFYNDSTAAFTVHADVPALLCTSADASVEVSECTGHYRFIDAQSR
jgi:hypothetical protein